MTGTHQIYAKDFRRRAPTRNVPKEVVNDPNLEVRLNKILKEALPETHQRICWFSKDLV